MRMKQGGDTRRETSLQQRADEIVAAIRQRKQQWRQRLQQPRITDDDRRRVETPRRQEERDTTGETRLAIIERGELQVRRRRRRRLVVATTTTVLACLSTVYYLPFTVHVHYIAVCCSATTGSFPTTSVGDKSRGLQLIYNYSCQLGDYSWELYYNMTTTPKKDDVKADNEVVDVETTEPGPSTRLPPLKAPTIQPLGGWKEVRNLPRQQPGACTSLYGFNYQEPSKTLGLYYAQFSELLLPPATRQRQRQRRRTTKYDRDSQHVESIPLRLTSKMSTHQEPTTSVWRIPNYRLGRTPIALR